jgi:mannose-6-phosphate isomerase
LKLLEIKSQNKLEVVQDVAEYLVDLDYKIVNMDLRRPWGFYFYIDPDQKEKFAKDFFDGVELEGIDASLPLQPKILVFAPNKRVSWQYHDRRSEIWRCISQECQTIMSDTDKESAPKLIKFGDVVNFTKGTRHRGGATNQWAIVAEIWQHTDPNNPSDEGDIVRIQDDFGR